MSSFSQLRMSQLLKSKRYDQYENPQNIVQNCKTLKSQEDDKTDELYKKYKQHTIKIEDDDLPEIEIIENVRQQIPLQNPLEQYKQQQFHQSSNPLHSKPKQLKIDLFFPKRDFQPKTLQFDELGWDKLKNPIASSKPTTTPFAQLQQMFPQRKVETKEQQPKVTKIDLNKLSEQERQKYLTELSQNDGGKMRKQNEVLQKEKQKERLKNLTNPKVVQKGFQDMQELLDEGGIFTESSIKIKKRIGTESKRLTTFNQMFESKCGHFAQEGQPVFEFNRLLKYLFLKDYNQADCKDEDCKIIPNNFTCADEYTKIFEYLFLNESAAQIKQDLIEFSRKKNISKFRRIQIRLDETQMDKDGTILAMRGPQNRIVDENTSDQSEDEMRDGICDVSTLKNHLILFSTKLRFQVDNLNKFVNKQMLFFGMLIEPQKSQYLAQIKIQTFINRNQFPDAWTDIILIPLQKITTFIREYQLLTQIEHTPLSQVILDPSSSQELIGQDRNSVWTIKTANILPNIDSLDPFFDYIQSHYNQSQINSIKDIVSQEKGICLLQGPPGTGKTHTLLGLLSGVYEYMQKNNKFPKKKILICAPSNAAIDEIILRILAGGIFDFQGKAKNVKLVRLGLLDEENEKSDQIKQVSLEDLAQKQLFSKNLFKSQADQKTISDLRIDLNHTLLELKKLDKEKKSAPSDQIKSIESKIRHAHEKKTKLIRYLDEIKLSKRQYKETYTNFIEKILNDAEIICSTLSTSGSEKLTKFVDQFDILIVDESAQSTEPSNIVPLRLGIKKMVLIGDPRQLPATTFSVISNQTLYNRSLFERILDNKFVPYFLDTQYRMHSEIRIFPSLYFYNNKLNDHETTNSRQVPMNFFKERVLFLDCYDSKEQKDNTSYINKGECQIILQLLKKIREYFPTQNIGIICAYKAQVKYIKNEIKQNIGDINPQILSINTVDSFQGQEKDIIIFTCVRSSQSGGIGFLNDGRRMNVALTRARNALLILGNAITLCQSTLWKSLLKNANERRLYRRLSYKAQSEDQILNNSWSREDTRPDDQLLYLLKRQEEKKNKKETFNIADFKLEGVYSNENESNSIIKQPNINPDNINIININNSHNNNNQRQKHSDHKIHKNTSHSHDKKITTTHNDRNNQTEKKDKIQILNNPPKFNEDQLIPNINYIDSKSKQNQLEKKQQQQRSNTTVTGCYDQQCFSLEDYLKLEGMI